MNEYVNEEREVAELNAKYAALKEPIKLIPTKSDADLAIELKAELAEAAQEWLRACSKANRSGFQVQADFGPDAFGSYVIHQLTLVKTF